MAEYRSDGDRAGMATTATSAGYWLPVFTLIVGFVLSSISQLISDRRARAREREAQLSITQRDREARDDARRDQLFERRTTFQRQTLLDLQDAVMRLVRTTGEMNHADVMMSRAGGKWQKQVYSIDLNDRAHLANVQTTMLGVRVADESVRELVVRLKTKCNATLFSRDEADAQDMMMEMTIMFVQFNERVGELLRKLDQDERTSL